MNNNEEIKTNEVKASIPETKFKPDVNFWGNKIEDFFDYYYTHYIGQMQNTNVSDVFDIGQLLREIKKVNAPMGDTSPQKIKSAIMWAVLPLYGIKEVDIAFMQMINVWDKCIVSPFGDNDMILIEEIPLHKDFVRKGIIGFLNNLARNHYEIELCSLSIKTRNKDLGRRIVYRQFARFFNGKSSIGQAIDAIFDSVKDREVQTGFYYITQGKEQCIEDFVDAMNHYKNNYMGNILNDKDEENKILNLKKDDYLKMKYGDELWNKLVLNTNNFYGNDDKYVPDSVGLYESRYKIGTSPLAPNDVVLKEHREPIDELEDVYKLICRTFEVMLYYDENIAELTIEGFRGYCSKYVEFINNCAKLYNTRLIKDIKPRMLLNIYDIDIHEALFIMYTKGSVGNPFKEEFKRLPVSDSLIGIGIEGFIKETKRYKFFNDLRDVDYISDGTNNELFSQDDYELHYGRYTKMEKYDIDYNLIFDYEGFFSGKLSVKEAFRSANGLVDGVDYGIEGYFYRNCPDLKYSGADILTFNEMVKKYHQKETFRLCMNGGDLDSTVLNIYDVSDVDNWDW